MSESVKKAYTILQYLSQNQGQATLSTISVDMGINKTTALRYLSTLESLHLIEKDDTTYSLGLGLYELGSKVRTHHLIVSAIRPILKELSELTNETISVAQLLDDSALYVEKIESNRGLQFKARIGDRLPLYCTGVGKTILWSLPEEISTPLLSRLTLKPYTQHTITSKEKLHQVLEEDKHRGYSVDKEELEEGLECIAIPLTIDKFGFYGSMSFSGSVDRFTDTVEPELVKHLRLAREKIMINLCR